MARFRRLSHAPSAWMTTQSTQARARPGRCDLSRPVAAAQRGQLSKASSARPAQREQRSACATSAVIADGPVSCHPERPLGGWRGRLLLLLEKKLKAGPSSGFALVRDDSVSRMRARIVIPNARAAGGGVGCCCWEPKAGPSSGFALVRDDSVSRCNMCPDATCVPMRHG